MDFAGIKTQNIKKKFDTYDILNRSITVEYNNQKILEISKFQSLPFKVFYKVTNTINNSHIYVDEEEKRLFSFKKYETFKVPENLKNFNIFFKVDHNGIYSIKYLSSPVFSISGNYVIIYDIQNEETYTFNATTDYGLNVPIMNVSYKSVTTISEPFKCFEREYKNDTIIATEFVFENFTDYFYMIKVNANEKPVSTKKVVTDIIRYGITQYRIPNDYCIVTFPPHLSERQKQVFMKCVENAESKDSIFVDEQIALAYGCEKEYNLPTDAFYIIVHYSDPKICISLVKVGLEFDKEYERILFEAEDFELSIDRLFDHIIDKYKLLKCLVFFYINLKLFSNNASSNNFEDMLDNCLLSICNLLETKTIYSIYVTRESLLFSIISEFFPKIQTSFIKFPEKIIAKGALYGCDITEDV